MVKELHPAQNASSRFGNLLLLLPTITVSCKRSAGLAVKKIECRCLDRLRLARLHAPRLQTLSVVMRDNMQFCQVFASRSATEPLLAELFDNNAAEETLITSSTQAGGVPSLFENPADISLQVRSGRLAAPTAGRL